MSQGKLPQSSTSAHPRRISPGSPPSPPPWGLNSWWTGLDQTKMGFGEACSFSLVQTKPSQLWLTPGNVKDGLGELSPKPLALVELNSGCCLQKAMTSCDSQPLLTNHVAKENGGERTEGPCHIPSQSSAGRLPGGAGKLPLKSAPVGFGKVSGS